MFYIKINDTIREYLNSVRDTFKLGCKDFCRFKLIALDEMELLRKELELKGIKTFTNEEFKELLKNSDKIYFNSIHLCDDSRPKEENSESLNDTTSVEDELVMNELKKDKVREINKKKYFDSGAPEYREDDSTNYNQSITENKKIKTENSLSYAFSMVGSFFLIVLGSYYLGKHFFGMQDSSTYKLVLVITIIVLISEMFLLIIKLNKSDDNKLMPEKLKDTSFAYRFNKKYREKFASFEYKKAKVHPHITKTKVE
jgi:hypothetical protein